MKDGLTSGAARVCLLMATVASAMAWSGCGAEVVGDDPPLDRIFDPVGIALHPSGRYLYVVNSNFDLDYREDRGGTVTVVDTDTLGVIPGSTVQIGTFGGDIALNAPPGGQGPTRAYVAVRGDKSVTALDLSEDGSALSCQGDTLSTRCRIPTSNEDPFGLAVASFDLEIDGQSTAVDFVAVAHLLGGDITGLTIRGESLDGFSRSNADIAVGANDIARSPRTGQFYVTSRFDNDVKAFRPVIGPRGELSGVFETASVGIDNAAPSGGFDSRGIAFNASGTMAFVANRGPDSLVFIDVGPTDPETGGGTRNAVVDVMLMPEDPAEIAPVEIDGRELLYVSSFSSKSITVVDPVTRAIVGNVELSSSPYGMAVDQLRHRRLYVSLFSEGAVGVVDIDPASPSFNQMTAVIR